MGVRAFNPKKKLRGDCNKAVIGVLAKVAERGERSIRLEGVAVDNRPPGAPSANAVGLLRADAADIVGECV